MHRTTSPQDRRVIHVALTPKGRELIERVLAVHFRNLATAVSGLTADEQSTLANLLRKLGHHAAALSAKLETPGTN